MLLNRHKLVSALLFVFIFASIFAVTKIKQDQRRAVLSEKKALANEEKAVKTLNLYIQEKKLTKVIGEHAVEQVKVIHDNYIKNLNFAKAIKFLDKTLEFQPNNEALYAMKGEAHFYRQQYLYAGDIYHSGNCHRRNLPGGHDMQVYSAKRAFGFS